MNSQMLQKQVSYQANWNYQEHWQNEIKIILDWLKLPRAIYEWIAGTMKNDKPILILCICCTKTGVYFLKKNQNCFILNGAIERTLFNCNTYQTCPVPQQAKSELHSVATKLQQILPLTDNFTQFKQEYRKPRA